MSRRSHPSLTSPHHHQQQSSTLHATQIPILKIDSFYVRVAVRDSVVDNKGARDDAYNKTGKRTRHINLRFHRAQEAVAKNSIDVKRVTGGNDPATSEMVADILTKSTPAPLFVVMASIMSGMHRK